MTLVFRHQVPHGDAAPLEGGDHLLGLAPRDAGVVHALDDEERLRDLVHVVERGGALHPGTHGRIALVAILDAPQVLAIAGRVLQEGGEVRDPHHVHRTADGPVITRGRDERHVTAVAAARHEHVVGVEVRSRADPLEQGSDVSVRPLPQGAVVELHERLPEAGRAPDVRKNQGDPQLLDVVVVAAQESGARLPLGPAVDVDDHRAAPRESRGRLVEKAGDLPSVEAGPVHQLGLGIVTRGEARGLALGPADERARRGRQRVRVAGRARRAEREPQLGAGAPPADAGDLPRGELGQAALDARRRVEHAQHAEPRFVGHEGDGASVGRQVELVHVPRDAAREEPIASRCEVQVGEALELRLAVGRDVDALAVATELSRAVGDAVARLLRREQRFRTARDVDEPEIAFVDGDRLRQQDLAVVRGPVGGLIAAALQLEHHAVARRLGRVHHPQVQIASVAARGHVGVTVALVRPGAADVPRLAVGQQGDITGRDIVAVLLEELRTADVLREHDVATVGRLVRGAGDGVGEERQLGPRPARKRDAVQLRRVAEPGGDDHLASRRVPVPEVGGSKLPVAARHVGDARRDRRHPVHHEILGPRRGGASLGERATGDERGDGKQETKPDRHTGSQRCGRFDQATATSGWWRDVSLAGRRPAS